MRFTHAKGLGHARHAGNIIFHRLPHKRLWNKHSAQKLSTTASQMAQTIVHNVKSRPPDTRQEDPKGQAGL
jgi:hypothetical protein